MTASRSILISAKLYASEAGVFAALGMTIYVLIVKRLYYCHPEPVCRAPGEGACVFEA